ncbi:MAG: lipoyl synthase [Nitrospinae bacterium RIFCSPLOWO2_12_FULL_47_7]|nr:MAG: lipoyl synthase [Nitrospinae bacterium RIFCSPLOWO2_12_FULL_47_7]
MPPGTSRLPEWLKSTLPSGERYFHLRSLVRELNLNTVCESATCPNIGKCWSAGTLTLMILGEICSRSCRFCYVPIGQPLPLRPHEPEDVALTLSRLRLRYAVITSVDRDDLADGGANHWAETLRKIRGKCPDMKIEALIPDFGGKESLIDLVCQALPDVLAHNLETVASLQVKIRPQSSYRWSLDTLFIARNKHNLVTKSGLMLGLGEKKDEVIQTIKDLVGVGCRILTLGQYLRPSQRHIEVVEYIHPDTFAEYREIGKSLGLEHVEAGTLVRSSYRADEQARAIGITCATD